jgi:hypothetical protein
MYRFHAKGALPLCAKRSCLGRQTEAVAVDDQQKRHSADPLPALHLHDVRAHELPIGGSSSLVAVATRQKQERDRAAFALLGRTMGQASRRARRSLAQFGA